MEVVVFVARAEPDHQEALTVRLSLYWKPVYFYLRRKGLSPDRAVDAVQDLFARLIECESPVGVPSLRTCLRQAADRYVTDPPSDQAEVRRGRAAVLPIDVRAAERELPAVAADAVVAYEREWAVTTLARALERLGREGVPGRSRGRPEAILRSSRFDHPPTYAEAAAECGMSVDRFRARLDRTRARFRELLREEVALTATEGGLEDEIRELLVRLRR
jgi:DNA-directed RNA polymerase specialized sigma24 family protein